VTDSLFLLPVDVALLAALFFLGWLVLRMCIREVDGLGSICTAIALGGGILTWAMFLASWAGLALEAGLLYVCYGSLVALFLITGFVIRRRANGESPVALRSHIADVGSGRRQVMAIWAIIALLLVASVVLSVGLSYYTWDDIHTWAVAGYGIAFERTILAAGRWGDAGLLYPLNTQLMIALFRIVDGDVLPGSKLLFPLFYLSLLVGCYRFWRRKGIRGPVASLGALLLATTPIVFTHATMGYTNLPFTCYLVLGSLWCIEAVEEASGGKALVGGSLLALGVWTRPEGPYMVGGALLAMALAGLLARRRIQPLLAAVLPIMAVGVSWMVFFKTHATGTVEAYTDIPLALDGLSRGEIYWGAIWTIARFVGGQVLRFRDWGFLLPIAGLGAAAGVLLGGFRRTYSNLALLLMVVSLGVVVLAAHYIAAYSPKGPSFVYEWLALEFNRVVMPVGTILVVFAVQVMSQGIEHLRGSTPA
jgi:hypothetical protein